MAFIDRLMGPATGSSTQAPHITYKNINAKIVQCNPPRRVSRLSTTKVYYDLMWEDAGKQYIREITKDDSLFNTLNNMRGFVDGGTYPCSHVDQPIPESANQVGRIKVPLVVWVGRIALSPHF